MFRRVADSAGRKRSLGHSAAAVEALHKSIDRLFPIVERGGRQDGRAHDNATVGQEWRPAQAFGKGIGGVSRYAIATEKRAPSAAATIEAHATSYRCSPCRSLVERNFRCHRYRLAQTESHDWPAR